MHQNYQTEQLITPLQTNNRQWRHYGWCNPGRQLMGVTPIFVEKI